MQIDVNVESILISRYTQPGPFFRAVFGENGQINRLVPTRLGWQILDPPLGATRGPQCNYRFTMHTASFPVRVPKILMTYNLCAQVDLLLGKFLLLFFFFEKKVTGDRLLNNFFSKN